MLKKRWTVFLLAVWLTGVRAQEIPVPPLGERLFPEWQAVDSTAALGKIMKPMLGTLSADWDKAGYARLPVNFSTTRSERVSWDMKINADLRQSRGIQFDFYCREAKPFSTFSLYFRSGEGWYHATFSPDRVGVWQRIVIDKTSTRIEGTVSGWGVIDTFRLSGWRNKDLDTVCALANVGWAGGKPNVLVVRADSNIKAKGGDGTAYLTYADTVSKTLDHLGIESIQIGDNDLAPELFEGIQLVILPYNSSVPEKAVEQIKGFVARGGKMLVCYALPEEVGRLLGLKSTDFIKTKTENFKGFTRTEQGLAAQPTFSPQASWCTLLVAPLPDRPARVIAVWRDSTGQDTEYPAVTLTLTGAFIGHVWLEPNTTDAQELMRSITGELVPEIWQQSAKQALKKIGVIGESVDFDAFDVAFHAAQPSSVAQQAFDLAKKMRANAIALFQEGVWYKSIVASEHATESALRAWFLTQKPQEGEHRAFWCHSAFGLRGKNWDDSIRILKENGFTAILPNMLWGGLAYYPSHVLPQYKEEKEKGDQIAQCLAACRKYGVACHIWKVNWNMSSRAPKAFVDQMMQEGRVQKCYDGTLSEGWLCPSHPANQEMEVASMLEIVRTYAVDGVHFDYIRYPGTQSCFCDGCRARFEAKLEHAVAHWPEDTLQDEAVRVAWLNFRRANIDTVVQRVALASRKIRPEIEISAAVFRNWTVDRDTVGQDWKMWCEQGWLDFVCPMDYLDSNLSFREVVSLQKTFVGKARLYPGIGLSCWKDSRNAVKLAEQIEIVRELGLSGFTVFNYDSNAEAVLPYLRLGVTADIQK